MINITKTANYETLKSAFRDGIEFRRTPFKTYFKQKLVNPTVDNEYMANVIQGLYIEPKSIKMLLSRTIPAQTDWNRVTDKVALTSYAEKLINEGDTKIADTFSRGMQNPSICFMAWYDAIAEYVLEKANSLIGQKPPIIVVNEELNNIEKNTLKDINYYEVKARVFESLKQLYPKTYKKRLKLLEQNYNTKVQNGITDIVQKLIGINK